MRKILTQYEYFVAGAELPNREAARQLQRDFRRANPLADKAMSKIKQRMTQTTERIVR